MKKILVLSAFALIAILSACDNNAASTKTDPGVNDTGLVKKDSTDGINVSLKGNTSVDLGGEGNVETKTGTDIQVNKR